MRIMPTPKKNESEEKFVERCIPIVLDEGTAKDNEQAVAICHSIYKQSKEKKSENVIEEDQPMYIKEDTIERRCLPKAEIRVDGDDKPKIIGYAAVFNTWTNINGWFKESIRPGAFTKTIKENDIRALMNHNENYVLGRNKSKTLSLREDSTGLAVEIDPVPATWANDLLASMRRGDITQMSFGFQVNKQEADYEKDERVLVDVTLFDVSIVTYPAYPTTTAQVRSLFHKEVIEEKKEEKTWEELDELVRKIKSGEKLTEEELRVIATYIPDLSVPPAKHTETPPEPPAKHSEEDTRSTDKVAKLLTRAKMIAPSK
jgi:hypothetical protein